jgi:putative membrane protein
MGWMGMWILPLLVGVVVWVMLRNRNVPDRPSETPEEILKRRYAKGEIDRDTYQRMLGDLRGG